MKLFLLRPINELWTEYYPWEPWYDKCFGFVVSAIDEKQARILADQEAGDENRGNLKPWIDEKYSTCVELKAEDMPEQIIINDFKSA